MTYVCKYILVNINTRAHVHNTTFCFKENAQSCSMIMLHGRRYSIEPGYCYLKPSYIFKIQTIQVVKILLFLVRRGGGE